MIYFELHYFSIENSRSVAHMLQAKSLYQALEEAHAFDATDAHEMFTISLWVFAEIRDGHSTTIGELVIRNNQRTLPEMPVVGAWRMQVSDLLRNMDAQYDGVRISELYSELISQIIELLIIARGIQSIILVRWLRLHARLASLLIAHQAVRHGDIKFAREIERIFNEIYCDCPDVPSDFTFDDVRVLNLRPLMKPPTLDLGD